MADGQARNHVRSDGSKAFPGALADRRSASKRVPRVATWMPTHPAGQ